MRILVLALAAANAVLLLLVSWPSRSPVSGLRADVPEANAAAANGERRSWRGAAGASVQAAARVPAEGKALPPSLAERAGQHPCSAPKGRALESSSTSHSLRIGKLYFTRFQALDDTGKFDLIVHLHGDEPVLRELLASAQPFVLVTITLPPNESYAPLFAGTEYLSGVIAAAEQLTSQHFERSASVRHVLVSAWSAGFVGVRSLLFQPEAELVDAFILLDGLHAPRGPNFRAYLEPFQQLARRAEREEVWLFVTHSSIPTSGFSSAAESAHQLIRGLGGKPDNTAPQNGALSMVHRFDSGGVHVVGYTGRDKAAHCAQLYLLRSILAILGNQWSRAERGLSQPATRVPD